MKGLTAVRWTPRRKRTHPYQAQSITDALAALPPAEPTFTPRRPSAAPATAPMAALSANVKVPPPPGVPTWATDRESMERTVDALHGFDFAAADAAQAQEGLTYAAVLGAKASRAPAPDLSRAERFVADMRFGWRGLPVFRRTAHRVGWRGLNEDAPLTGWVRYTVARWDQQARIAIAAATEEARAEIHADFDAARQRVMAPGRAAAGAR